MENGLKISEIFIVIKTNRLSHLSKQPAPCYDPKRRRRRRRDALTRPSDRDFLSACDTATFPAAGGTETSGRNPSRRASRCRATVLSAVPNRAEIERSV